MTFEQLDRSIDADSDSDDDLAEQAHLYRCESYLNLCPPHKTSWFTSNHLAISMINIWKYD
jgi:hypothetical protein